MKIEQIEQIIEVARTGSQNKAAKKLFISQPNLCTSIKNLENELNIKIFERTNQGMVLTALGQQLVHYAEPVYQQFLLMPELFSNIVHRQKKMFSLSNAYMKFVSNVLCATVNNFSSKPFFIKYIECTSDEVIENVATQTTDLGVLYFSSIQKNRILKLMENKKLTYTKLLDDELKVIFGKKNPMYQKGLKEITSEELAQYPIVVYDSPYSSELLETIQLNLGNAPQIIIVNSRGSKLDILKNTNAVGIGTNSSIPYKYTNFYTAIKTLPLKNISFSMEVGWVARSEAALSEYSTFFIDKLTAITENSKENNNAALQAQEVIPSV